MYCDHRRTPHILWIRVDKKSSSHTSKNWHCRLRANRAKYPADTCKPPHSLFANQAARTDFRLVHVHAPLAAGIGYPECKNNNCKKPLLARSVRATISRRTRPKPRGRSRATTWQSDRSFGRATYRRKFYHRDSPEAMFVRFPLRRRALLLDSESRLLSCDASGAARTAPSAPVRRGQG